MESLRARISIYFLWGTQTFRPQQDLSQCGSHVVFCLTSSLPSMHTRILCLSAGFHSRLSCVRTLWIGCPFSRVHLQIEASYTFLEFTLTPVFPWVLSLSQPLRVCREHPCTALLAHRMLLLLSRGPYLLHEWARFLRRASVLFILESSAPGRVHSRYRY